MPTTGSGLLRSAARLAVLTAMVVVAPSGSTAAARELFFEETAEAFWAVPHECADGSTVQATLLVQSTRDFEAPDTDDPDPTARVQFLAVCPDGTSFSWGACGAGDDHEHGRPQERGGRRIRHRQGQPGRHPPGLLRRGVVRRRAAGDDGQRRREASARSERRPRQVRSPSTATSSSTVRPTTRRGRHRSSASTPRTRPPESSRGGVSRRGRAPCSSRPPVRRRPERRR